MFTLVINFFYIINLYFYKYSRLLLIHSIFTENILKENIPKKKSQFFGYHNRIDSLNKDKIIPFE